MSTTVNVKVDKSQLSQQLKDQAAQSRFEAEKEGTPANPSREERQQQEAVAEAVRQVLDVQGDDGQLKLKKRRRQLSANREQSGRQQGLDPDEPTTDAPTPEEELADGVVPLGRVTIRRSGNRYLICPWSVEAARGERLSSNYNTAKQEAGFLAEEIVFPDNSFPDPVPEPAGTLGKGPRFSLAGRAYDVTPYGYVTYRVGQIYDVIDGTFAFWLTRFSSPFCYTPEAVEDIRGNREFIIEKRVTFGEGSNCQYFAGYFGDSAAAGGTFTSKEYEDRLVSTGAGPLSNTYEVVLPIGNQDILVVLINRSLNSFARLRLFWQFDGASSVVRQTKPSVNTIYGFTYQEVETDASYSGGLDTSLTSVDLEGACTNEVRCVLVTNTAATEIEASAQLIAACDALVERLEAEKATANLETGPVTQTRAYSGNQITSTTSAPYKYKGFEVSNIPKAPYYETPADKQVLAKQFGMGYLGTTNHTGNFITPAVFDWFTKQPTLDTSYAPHITRYQASFSERTKPFPGFYLAVPAAGFDGEVMTAILATPQDINTQVTVPPEQSIEVETQSTFGDYLVWDWGNPEYCRTRLTQLGMGFLF